MLPGSWKPPPREAPPTPPPPPPPQVARAGAARRRRPGRVRPRQSVRLASAGVALFMGGVLFRADRTGVGYHGRSRPPRGVERKLDRLRMTSPPRGFQGAGGSPK